MDDISNYVKRLMASIESLHEKNVHLEAKLHNTINMRESETAIAVHDCSEPENLLRTCRPRSTSAPSPMNFRRPSNGITAPFGEIWI